MAAKKKAPKKKPPKAEADPCAWLKTQGFGRPSKISDTVAKAFIAQIVAGHYIEDAAAYSGIHPNTAFRWLKRGSEADEASADALFFYFWCAFKKARAACNVKDLAIIKCRGDNWQALGWCMERREPPKWGRVNYVDLKDREKTLGDDLTDRQILAARFSKEDQDARGSSRISQNGNGRRHTNGKK